MFFNKHFLFKFQFTIDPKATDALTIFKMI